MIEGIASGLIVVAICLLLGAYFSAVETTLTSLSSVKAKQLRENSGPFGKVLDLWIKIPHRILIATLIGSNLVNIFAAVYMDNLITKHFGQAYTEAVTLAMTGVIVVFSEIIPKTLSKGYATTLAIPFLYVFRFFYWLVSPFTIAIAWMTDKLSAKLSKHVPQPTLNITEEELEFLIDVGEEEGVLPEQKHEMLSGIFELGDTVVREIMVSRTDMIAVNATLKASEAVNVFRESGFSRIPVFDERIDNIVGILHFKDVAYFLDHADLSEKNIKTVVELKRSVIFVPEQKEVDELFQEMRRKRQHMVIVLDEYGNTSGLVTMEDVFEEIVGEIRDEFDNEEDAIRPTQITNQYIVECKIHFDDFCDFFEIEKQAAEDEESGKEYDTLGGYIMHQVRNVPKIGDKLELDRVSIEILEVSKRRVRKVLVRILHPVKNSENED